MIRHLLPAFLLLAAAAPAQQSWSSGRLGQATYELGGELRFRGDLRDTADQATGLGGSDDNLDVRAAVELGVTYDEYISGRLRAIGTANDGGSNDQDLELAFLDLDQLLGDYHLRLGRMQFDLGDGRLVSSNPWLFQQNAFDGVLVSDSDWQGDWQLWYSQAATGPAGVDDNTFAGAFLSLPMDANTLEFYLLRRGDGATDLLEWTYALRYFGTTYNGLEWNLLGALQDGRDRSLEVLAPAFVINLTKRLDYGHNLAVELAWAQGNDERPTDRKRFDPVYIDQHRYNGRADIVAFSNLVDLGLFYWLDWNERWSLHADYHDFTRQSNLDDIYLGVANTPVTAGSSSNAIGGELDIYAEGRISEAMSLDLGASYFNPGAAMPHNEDQIWLFFDLSLYF